MEDATVAQHATEVLQRDGIFMMPGFCDIATIERIKSHLVDATLNERFCERRRGFKINTVPPDVHVAEYETSHLLTQPDILALLQHPYLLDVATSYLGCKPTISSLSVWWSFPTDGSAQEAENYHRDVDDWRFVKFFLYLTDVTDGAGPHRFIRTSHRSSKFLFIRRLEDKAVESRFKLEDCLAITGKAGTAFLEDTFGLHKGQPPLDTKRLVLQIQYSINPIPVYDYNPEASRLAVNHDAYINRLYLKPTSNY